MSIQGGSAVLSAGSQDRLLGGAASIERLLFFDLERASVSVCVEGTSEDQDRNGPGSQSRRREMNDYYGIVIGGWLWSSF